MWTHVLRALPAQTLARLLEALWPFLLAAWFGAGRATDLYYGAQAASLLVVALAAGAFQDSAVVPRLARARERGGAEAEHEVIAALSRIAWRLGVVVFAAFLLIGSAYLWLGFRASWGDLLRFVVPFAFCAPAMTLRSLWVASVQARGALSVAPLVSATSVFLSTAVVFGLRTSFGIAAVPLGLLVGECGAALVAAAFAMRAGVQVRQLGDASHPDARALVKLVGSEVLGGAFTRLNPVIDQACVRALGVAGAVTHVKYASDIAGVPTSLAGSAVLPVVFLTLSRAFAEDDRVAFQRTTRQAAWQITAMLALASALLWALRGPVVAVLFGHGQMTAADTAAMSSLLPWGLANAIPFGLMLLYVRANIALGNSGIMWRVGLLNAALNVLFDVALGRVWGVGGVVLGTAFTHGVVAWVLYTQYRRTSARLGHGGGALTT